MTTSLVKQPPITVKGLVASPRSHDSFPVRRFTAVAILFFVIASAGVSVGAVHLLDPHRAYFDRVGDRFVAAWERSESPVIRILRD